MKNSIIILVPFFGKWPEWAHLYFETLRRNNTIDFLFYTDCDASIIKAPNIQFKKLSFDAYVQMASSKLGFQITPSNAYKLCDLRPMFGYIHQHDFKGYEYYGWLDMDLLLGDVRSFYTPEVLDKYDVFSTHAHTISGHFALFRNISRNREMYKNIYRWKEALNNSEFVGIDEHGITNAYLQTVFDKFNEKYNVKISNFITRFFSNRRNRKLYRVEQYTTPFLSRPWIDGTLNSQQPDIWYYNDGIITNERDTDRKFMYLHFMNFKSSQWRHDGTNAPWEGHQICNAKVEDMNAGLVINKKGIFPLDGMLR